MSYCNFSTVLKILYSNIDKSTDLDHNMYRANQVDFLSKLFEQYTYDNDVIFTASYAAAFFNNKNTAPYKMQLYCKTHFAKFLGDVREYLLPWLIDRHKAADELYALIRSDDTISDEKQADLTDGANLGDDSALALFFANVILFSMSKPLQPSGALITFSGKAFLDNIAVENEAPLPCKFFCGRDREIDELHTLLSVHRHVFVNGIAGIGKSEFVKGYVQKHRSHYDRCIYLNYNGDLEAMICELEQSGDSKAKCFSHNYRQLRTLSENTLLVVDNFNTTEAKEPHLYQLLKLKCRIVFTTRSKFECGHTFELKEISDIDILTDLFLKFCPDIADDTNTIRSIIETVHRHTYAVEIAARVLNRGLISPTELLTKLRQCAVNPHISERVKAVKDDRTFSETYYSHISLLFSLLNLDEQTKYTLRCSSFIPVGGIRAKAFARVCALPDLNTVYDLDETGLLKIFDDGLLTIHPIIRDLVLEELNPSTSNCKRMLKRVYNICTASGKDIRNYTAFFELILSACGAMIIDNTEMYIRLLEEVFGYMQKYRFYRGMAAITEMYTKGVADYPDRTKREEALMNDRKAVCAAQIDGNFGRAVRFAKKAYELSKEWGLELQMNMANNLAVVYFESGDLANAERYADEAIKIYRSLESDNHNAIPILKLKASILALTKRPLEAITILQKLKALLEAADNAVSYDYAEITKDLAQAYLIVGNVSSAKSEIILSLETYRQVLDYTDFSTLARRYVEIFRCVPNIERLTETIELTE